MNYTAKYRIQKPLITEKYDIEVYNTNMDMIDAALTNLKDKGNEESEQLTAIRNALNTHENNVSIHISESEREAWNESKTHAESAHARTDATKTESSEINGNIKINGIETKVYIHPSGTNPHGTTKNDIGLENVENKSSASIRSELTKENVTNALGYVPYTPNEVDNKLSALETNIDWKESVDTFELIPVMYPDPQDGWTVNVKDTDYTYRYNGTEWVAISANAIPKATRKVDGLLSKEDKIKYDDANAKKHEHANQEVLDKLSESDEGILLFNGNQIQTPDTTGVKDGLSAYEIAVNQGFVGTESDWLESLKGKNGNDGSDGISISSVIQTTTSNKDAGTNIITVTLSDGSESTLNVKNGSKGSDGRNGTNGFSPIISENSENDLNTYRLDIATEQGSFTTPNLKSGTGNSDTDIDDKLGGLTFGQDPDGKWGYMIPNTTEIIPFAKSESAFEVARWYQIDGNFTEESNGNWKSPALTLIELYAHWAITAIEETNLIIGCTQIINNKSLIYLNNEIIHSKTAGTSVNIHTDISITLKPGINNVEIYTYRVSGTSNANVTLCLPSIIY